MAGPQGHRRRMGRRTAGLAQDALLKPLLRAAPGIEPCHRFRPVDGRLRRSQELAHELPVARGREPELLFHQVFEGAGLFVGTGGRVNHFLLGAGQHQGITSSPATLLAGTDTGLER